MLPVITSLHNPRVKQAAQLRDRAGRESQQRIIIDGMREVERALAADVEFLEVFAAEKESGAPSFHDLLAEFRRRDVAVYPVVSRVYSKLAYGERAAGIVAIAATPRAVLAEFTPPAAGLVAVLVGIEKPGNVGAIVRSADGAGVSAVIVADGGTDLFNPNAIRASLGTIFSVPIFAATTLDTLAWLRHHRIVMYSARVGAQRMYFDAPWRQSSALILGSEAHGLHDAWSAEDIIAIGLPMLGSADSLNVSATAAVIFYEALRQRGNPPTK